MKLGIPLEQKAAPALVLLLSILLAGCGEVGEEPLPAGVEANGTRRPNIILILVDDLGYGDLGCFGNEVNQTPHIDRLASEGLRFTDFHSNGPMCSPTRAALLTGLYQNRFGPDFETALSAVDDRERGLPLDVLTIPEALRSGGYATAMYGKWHLGVEPPYLPTSYGFDDFRGLLTGDGDHHSHISRSGTRDWWHNEQIEMEQGYSVDLITGHTIDFLRRHRARPCFVYVSHLAIHFPWQGPDEGPHRVEGGDYWNLTKLGPHKPREVGPVVRQMVEAVDESVGRILQAVRELGADRPTFIFFASDNGGYRDYGGKFQGEISDNGPLRGQKTEVWEGGHRVPAIAWMPRHIESGRVTGETALTMDLLPTICDLAGIDPSTLQPSRSLDGTSLTGLLFQERSLAERSLFWRAGAQKAARRGDWKLVEIKGKEMLFNLGADITEQNDFAGEHPERLEQLKKDLADWEKDVDGP